MIYENNKLNASKKKEKKFQTIFINFINHILKLWLCGILTQRSHYCSQLISCNCAISVTIKETKCFFKFSNLFFCQNDFLAHELSNFRRFSTRVICWWWLNMSILSLICRSFLINKTKKTWIYLRIQIILGTDKEKKLPNFYFYFSTFVFYALFDQTSNVLFNKCKYNILSFVYSF